jgi:PAS domain S-box-containing protein
MGEETRPSGINIVGDIPWGTHFCQFYQTKEDLLDILVPYFKAGLENNEFCMWITTEPLKEQAAQEALRRAIPDFDRYLKRGQIEILPHDKWYLKDGVFHSDRVLNGWLDKLNHALAKGYDGLRLTGNTFWLEKTDWNNFADYEAVVNNVIRNYRMIAICSYCLEKCEASELIDVVTNHQFCVIRREGEWRIFQSSERRRMEEELRQSGERYQIMLRTVMDGFWIVDTNGRFLEVNDAYCLLTGYSRQELLSMSIPDVEASERPEETARHIQRVIQTGADRFETRHRCKDGRIVDLEVSVNYSSSEGGRLYVFFQDITERKVAEEQLQEARNELETRVKERTAELQLTNARLKEENEKRVRTEQSLRLEEARLEALLRLSQMTKAPVSETAGFILEHGIALTRSKIGFVGFLSEDEAVYTLHAISKDVVKECNVTGDPVQWHVAGAGIWADAIREHRTLFVNDYSKPHASKKGLPTGHPPVSRLMVVPLFDGQRIVAVAGMGNKASDYDKSDERQITLLLSGMWNHVQESRSREALKKAYDELDQRVKQRTAELAASNAALQEEISERIKVEEALQESQKDLNRAQAVAQTGSWRLDIQRNELLWSDETYRIFGIPKRTPMTYETFISSVHPEDREYVDSKWTAALRGEQYDIKHRIIVGDEVKWVREKAELESNQQGVLKGGFGTVQDITERIKAEAELAHLASFPELSPMPILELNMAGDVTYLTPATRTLFPDLVTRGSQHPFLANWDALVNAIQNEKTHLYSRDIKVGGSWFEQTLFYLPSKQRFRLYGRDITKRKQAEEELFRVNRALRAISECNQAMVRATDEQALLKDVCRIICDVADYRMAWVGVAEQDDAKSIRPLAWGGAEDGYLANTAITWADTEHGRGPTGLAVRSGKTHFFQDFATEPAASPWREAALTRGYRSSIAIPLSDTAGNVFEVFSLYAGQPNSFTPAEVELLEELTTDLAFGISVLRDRVKRKQAEEELQETRDYLENLLNYANAPIIVWDPEFRITRFNHAFERLTMSKAKDVLGKKLDILFPQDRRDESLAHIRRAVAGERWEVVEIPILRKDGEVRTVLWNSATLYAPDGRTAIATIAQGQDITERKQAEEALRDREAELSAIFQSTPMLMLLADSDRHVLKSNNAAAQFASRSMNEMLGLRSGEALRCLHSLDDPNGCGSGPSCKTCLTRLTVLDTLETGNSHYQVECRLPFVRNGSTEEHIFLLYTFLLDLAPKRALICIQDITQLKQAEEALRETQDYLESLINYANAPIIVWDPEFRITRFNHAFERLTGLKAEDVLSKKLDILFPQDRCDESLAHIRRAVAGERWEVVEIPILRTDGTVRTVLWNSATLYDPDDETVVATIAQGQDITERKQGEEALKRRTDELARSNAELEQFAYVASHDLQEPLRMVSSYVKLLAKRYKGKLDQDADEFIDYAHDGAMRMQRLINDLLAYSRVGTRGKKFEEVNLETVLAEALHNLKVAIKDNEAIITHDPLPSIYGDSAQLSQIFQNLIDNAIKFRGEELPRVHISAEVSRGECVCSVCDNGIGIAPEYSAKVFALFQRLHTRKEYPGTGIGLSICK